MDSSCVQDSLTLRTSNPGSRQDPARRAQHSFWRRGNRSHAPLLPGWAEPGPASKVSRATLPGSRSRGGPAAPLLDPRVGRARTGPRASRRPEGHCAGTSVGARRRPLLTRPDASPLPVTGQTTWRSRTRRCNLRQQEAPDFPLSPQPGRAGAPAALRSPLGRHRRVAWRPTGPGGAGPAALGLHGLRREPFGAAGARGVQRAVRPADAEAVFQRLDANRDGAIAFQEFARGFRGTHRRERRRGGGPREAASAAAEAGPDSWDSEEDAATVLGAPWCPASPCRACQDFWARVGDEAKFIPRLCSLGSLWNNGSTA
ncbi:translation initiation factor IF-2-like [Choloepus didactylus]|uniref:translation initiation factor IF-2-like n=1 Tax=Choloepus didactylus TaxID=27675 RepID=UPI00189F6F3B|nr:translation initiation factor IF-2-like [Choloepus didactylus]